MSDPAFDSAAFELLAAPHTPFRPDGELAVEPVARQAAHLRSAGVDGVLVAGSTGEGPSLTTAERYQLTERWVEVGGSLRVMIHVGHDSLGEAFALARHAAGVGARAICAAPPSWFKITTAEQLADTCGAIAAAAPDLPFFYYHIPVLSGVNLAMAPFLDLARERIPNFAGVKFTHDDLADFRACRERHGAAVRMLWGIDERLVEGIAAGADGAVGSTYNFAAPLYRRLLAAYRDGHEATAVSFQADARRLVDVLAQFGYPAAAKSAMSLLGVDCGPVRLPLARLSDDARTAVRGELEALGFFEWLAQ